MYKEVICVTYGKSTELFLVNGTADSIITAELSNWNLKSRVLKLQPVTVMTYLRQEFTFFFVKRTMGLIPFTSVKRKISKID